MHTDHFVYYQHYFKVGNNGTVTVSDIIYADAKRWIQKRFVGNKVTYIKTVTN